MKKNFTFLKSQPLIPFLVLGIGLFVVPQIVHAEGLLGGLFSWGLDSVAQVFGWIAVAILQIVSAITYLAGSILNYVIKYTIVDMSTHVGEANISDAWGVIRDVANMGFIFVLLYAAITTIIGMGQDNKKLIVNMVVAAILINFSLFFTKLVIDAANMLALIFYGAMVPAEALVKGGDFINAGLANSIMEPLRIQSIFMAAGSGITGNQLLIIGVLGSVVALIAAFVFFAIAILLVIRFVVLLFIMVLSPIAFVAGVLPHLQKYQTQWKDALIGQAFFAPIYFMLTWVVIKISQGLPTSGSMAAAISGTSKVVDGQVVMQADPASMSVLVNFMVIIALIIASLMIAKEWAGKAGPQISGLTKWAMGAAGGATMGMAGRVGRNFVGSRAAEMANNEELKRKAAEGGIRARLQLATANKAAKSSFDLRGTGLGGTLGAGSAKKGGFIQDQKDRAKAYEKYKPSKDAEKEAGANSTNAETALKETQRKAREEAKTAVPKPAELEVAERELESIQTENRLNGVLDSTDPRVDEAKKHIEEEKEKHNIAIESYVKSRTAVEEKTYEEIEGVEMEMANRMENMAKTTEDQTLRVKIPFIGRGRVTVPSFVPTSIAVAGKSKAAAIRAASKGKSRAERIAELAAEEAKEKEKEGKVEEKTEEKPKTPPPPTTPTP